MEIETSEQLAFIPEQVENIMIGVIDGVLKTEVYLEEKVNKSLRMLGLESFGKESCGLFFQIAPRSRRLTAIKYTIHSVQQDAPQRQRDQVVSKPVAGDN